MATLDDLNGLLSPLPGYGVLTDAMKQRALETALIPDGAGVWPGQPGYQTTYDIYWAALSLIGFMQAQPVVRQTSSEGTSVAVDAPNWAGITAYYRGASVIAGASQNGPLLTLVPIPDVPHVRRTDMSGRGGGPYDDVDTDLA
ncbi:hypothetical protein SEA_SCHIMMELS22_10 [Microbacterium phage Schimmels22]|nr:hypothetical protein SEA_SCHIMMELS22_10 [Microbacterium phage Schimmels22]